MDDAKQTVLRIDHRHHAVVILGEQFRNVLSRVILFGLDDRRDHQFPQRHLVGRQDQVAQIDHAQEEPLRSHDIHVGYCAAYSCGPDGFWARLSNSSTSWAAQCSSS